MKRIGVFGGTFDPPHVAHAALARVALDTLALDEVRWIPAGQPWQKARSITPAVHREAMTRLAIEGEPRFVLDRIELERQGPSYTLDTLRALRPLGELFLLIGADQYARLPTWHDWQELPAWATLAVAGRPGAAPPSDARLQCMPHRALPLPMHDISATDIRARVARGQPLDGLVAPAVARYIESHALYRS